MLIYWLKVIFHFQERWQVFYDSLRTVRRLEHEGNELLHPVLSCIKPFDTGIIDFIESFF